MQIFKKLLIFLGVFLLFLVGAQAAYAFNDLEASSLSVSPTSPARNEPVTITVTVYNRGDETLNSNTGFDSINYSFRNFSETSQTLPAISSLAPGNSVNYTFEGSFTSEGTKHLSFAVNSSGALTETKTNNNSVYTDVEVTLPYDLSVELISVTPSKPAVDQDAQIEVKAKNNGYLSLWAGTGITSISYNFPDFTIEETTYPLVNTANQLESGEYFYYKFMGKFTSSGTKELSFTIDNSDQMEEKDEENNVRTDNVTVGGLARHDLFISSFEISIEKPIIDEELTITIKARNDGETSLTDSKGLLFRDDFTVFPGIPKDFTFSLPDFNIEQTEYDDYPSFDNPLDPGQTFTYSFTGSFTKAGEKNLVFNTNYNHRLAEANYANNSKEEGLTVYLDEEDRDSFHFTSYGVEYLSSSSVMISWETDLSVASKLEYKRAQFTSYSEEVDFGEATTRSTTLEDLIPNMKYQYRISANKNEVEREVVDYFTTPGNDILTLTSGPAVSVDNKTATVTWSTNLSSNGTIHYKINSADSYTEASESGNNSDHEIILNSLAPGSYLYYVSSESTVGATIDSAIGTFTVAGTASQETSNTEESETETEASQEQSGEETGQPAASATVITNEDFYNNLKGKIILQVEANGEAYYISPQNQEMYYLGRPDDAFSIMREQGVGITNANLSKIPIGLNSLSGDDSDNDQLSDLFEDAIGTDKNNPDSDGDSFNDYDEVVGDYNPLGGGGMNYDNNFAGVQKGKIFLQVEGHGEAWYVNPADGKRYFLGRPADAFNVMRFLGLGISNANFSQL